MSAVTRDRLRDSRRPGRVRRALGPGPAHGQDVEGNQRVTEAATPARRNPAAGAVRLTTSTHRTPGPGEAAADWHHRPEVARTAGVVDDRFYVVEVEGHRSVVYHGIIERACDPIDDEPPPGAGEDS